MGQNLIVMRFAEADRASAALSELRAASAAGRLQLLQAALVRRDGQSLSGPEGQRLLEALQVQAPQAAAMDEGAIALLAHVREFSEREVDGLAQELGVRVLRHPLPAGQADSGLASR